MDEEIKDEVKDEVKETPEQKENIVETIIQNGVSKEELAEMLKDILGKENPTPDAAAIEAAETEYFGSHLKY